ncbi:long-chain fatty acid--CoA ligase [Dactylosporangium sp. NPDC051485]|uniref:class I adenylate-forming enzyme family protein n=1 Tax=Dactylosporangium sp. NPDC051485 TaxID=3154846 RepID=UPI00342616F8
MNGAATTPRMCIDRRPGGREKLAEMDQSMNAVTGADMAVPLRKTLREYADRPAFVYAGQQHTYRELLSMADEWTAYLDAESVGAGAVTMLEGVSSPHTCAALLALIERQAIIVPRTPSSVAADAELTIAEVEVVLGAAGSGRRTCRRTGQSARNELYARLRAAGSPGLVLFSSGTTGRSKASVLDFAKLLARHRPGAAEGRRVLQFPHFDHIGGINTLLRTLAGGGTVVTVPERTPDTVFGAIAAHGVQVLPTTPTFLKMALLTGADRRYPTDTLELITYGAEPMPQHTLELLRAALPAVRLKQIYGLSELGILPTKSRADGSRWMKLGTAGFAHRIVDGILWIKSDTAMLGYLNASAEFDDEGYFNTQDMVEIDGEYIRILGRRSEIINVGGEKVYPSEVENVVLEVPNVCDVTVTGHPSPILGMVVKATVRLERDEDEHSVRLRVREHCRNRLAAFKVPALMHVSHEPMHTARFKKARG